MSIFGTISERIGQLKTEMNNKVRENYTNSQLRFWWARHMTIHSDEYATESKLLSKLKEKPDSNEQEEQRILLSQVDELYNQFCIDKPEIIELWKKGIVNDYNSMTRKVSGRKSC